MRRKRTGQDPVPDRIKRSRPNERPRTNQQVISAICNEIADEKQAARKFKELWPWADGGFIFCPSLSLPYVIEFFSTLMDRNENTPLGALVKARYRERLLRILWGEVKENPVHLVFTLETDCAKIIPTILLSFETEGKTVKAPQCLLQTNVHSFDDVRSVEEIMLGKKFCFAKSLFERELKELFPVGIPEIILSFLLYI